MKKNRLQELHGKIEKRLTVTSNSEMTTKARKGEMEREERNWVMERGEWKRDGAKEKDRDEGGKRGRWRERGMERNWRKVKECYTTNGTIKSRIHRKRSIFASKRRTKILKNKVGWNVLFVRQMEILIVTFLLSILCHLSFYFFISFRCVHKWQLYTLAYIYMYHVTHIENTRAIKIIVNNVLILPVSLSFHLSLICCRNGRFVSIWFDLFYLTFRSH